MSVAKQSTMLEYSQDGHPKPYYEQSWKANSVEVALSSDKNYAQLVY